MFCKDNFLIKLPGAQMMLESKNRIAMQQRASIMKMGRRLESWLILQIRGKLPIEKKNSQITRRRNLHLWRWPESQASLAATAVRNNREGSGAIWLLGDNGAINVRLRRKNPDCCLNSKPGFLVLYEQERERLLRWWEAAWQLFWMKTFCFIQTIVLTTCTRRYRRKILILWN